MSVPASAACSKRMAPPAYLVAVDQSVGRLQSAELRIALSREQHGDYAGDENAVECARTADRRNRRPELRNRAEVKDIRAEEASDGARDIRDRGRAAAVEYDGEHRSHVHHFSQLVPGVGIAVPTLIPGILTTAT